MVGAPATTMEPAAAMNPWANLGGGSTTSSTKAVSTAAVNEELLMKQSEANSALFQKATKQEMTGPKPCANCNCGLKE